MDVVKRFAASCLLFRVSLFYCVFYGSLPSGQNGCTGHHHYTTKVSLHASVTVVQRISRHNPALLHRQLHFLPTGFNRFFKQFGLFNSFAIWECPWCSALSLPIQPALCMTSLFLFLVTCLGKPHPFTYPLLSTASVLQFRMIM